MLLGKQFFIESKKHKGRHLLALILGVIVFEMLFIYANFRKEAGSPDGWMLLFYNIPIMNSLFFPIVMAIFASRLVDLEHKGDMLKCLYTFASPRAIFFTKALYGVLHLLLLVLFQTGSIFIMARILRFSTVFPISYLVYFGTATFLSSMTLFLIHLILAFFMKNQGICISTGILGCFLGLFSSYLPTTIFQVLLPWSSYVSSLFIRLNWDKETRNTCFVLTRMDPLPLLVSLAWIFALLLFSSYLLQKAGIEEKESLKRNSFTKSVQITKRPVEIMKLKHSPSWFAFFLVPLLSAVIGTMNYKINIDILTNGWYSLWTQHTLFLCYFFMPVIISLLVGCIWRVDHQGTNMSLLLTHTTPLRVILSKFFASICMTTLSILWILLLYVSSGFLCHVKGEIPIGLVKWVGYGLLATYSICAVQLFLSLVIRNFVLPIAIAFLGGLAGLFFIAQNMPYSIPYSLFAFAMTDKSGSIDSAAFLLRCTLYIVVALASSVFYLKHSDIRSHE